MKKHYLFMMDTDVIGGAERLLMDYFNFIDYDKYSVIWGVRKDNFSSYLKKYNLPVKIVEFPLINNMNLVKNFFKFYDFFREIKPDCIVFNQFFLKSFSLPELLAGYMISKGNVFMIVHDCAPCFPIYKSKLNFGFIPGIGLEWRLGRVFQKLSVYFSKYSITVSQASKELLLKYHKFPSSKIKVAYHGVNIQKFVPSSENRIKFRKYLNIPDTDTIIISTAMLYIIKRLDRLIESFGILAQQRKNLWLIFVGTGSQYDNLIKMTEFFNEDIKRRIKFLGLKEDVASVLGSCDIYVLPSDSEGLSIACLEAMSCGLITIVTDCGGPAEVIRNGWNGFVVEKSTKGIMDGIEKALNLSDDEKSKILHNARKFIVDNFNLKDRVEYALNLIGIN